MSKFVKVRTELRDLALIKQALDDLQAPYKEQQRFTHFWSGFSGQLPLVVMTPQVTFGLRKGESDAYEVVGDDMQLRGIQSLLQQIQQRYAYHKVLAETRKAGFDLVEESVGRDNVIRMTVRRWA